VLSARASVVHKQQEATVRQCLPQADDCSQVAAQPDLPATSWRIRGWRDATWNPVALPLNYIDAGPHAIPPGQSQRRRKPRTRRYLTAGEPPEQAILHYYWIGESPAETPTARIGSRWAAPRGRARTWRTLATWRAAGYCRRPRQPLARLPRSLLAPWTTRDIAAHLILRERDHLAGPGLILPGAWSRFAQRRQTALARRDFPWLTATLRSGPRRASSAPDGCAGWRASTSSSSTTRTCAEPTAAAPGRTSPRWTRPCGATSGAGAGSSRGGCTARALSSSGRGPARPSARRGEPTARIAGPPGEMLLYLFGRQQAAQVEVSGPDAAVQAVRSARFGMRPEPPNSTAPCQLSLRHRAILGKRGGLVFVSRGAASKKPATTLHAARRLGQQHRRGRCSHAQPSAATGNVCVARC
jgi:hypothetical protein